MDGTAEGVEAGAVVVRTASAPLVLPASPTAADDVAGALTRSSTAPPERRQPWQPQQPQQWPILPRVVSTAAMPQPVRRVVRAAAEAASSRALAPTFLCVVCMENCAMKAMTNLEGCTAGATHAMCRECATAFLTGRVTEGQVDALRCPLFGTDGCTATATEPELRTLLTPNTFSRWERFTQIQQDATLRECPVCTELVKPQTAAGGAIVADMMCVQGHPFCYYHSNAHPPGGCHEYGLVQAKDERAAMSGLGAKDCPACGIITLKSSGCNHMSCTACKTDWCWTCGQRVGRGAGYDKSFGWHYSPANPAGCLQFQEVEGRCSALTLVARLMALPGALLGTVLFWVTLPTWITLCIGAGLSALAVLLLQLAWLPIEIVFVTLLMCCGGTSQHTALIFVSVMNSWLASMETVFPVVPSQDELKKDKGKNDIPGAALAESQPEPAQAQP